MNHYTAVAAWEAAQPSRICCESASGLESLCQNPDAASVVHCLMSALFQSNRRPIDTSPFALTTTSPSPSWCFGSHCCTSSSSSSSTARLRRSILKETVHLLLCYLARSLLFTSHFPLLASIIMTTPSYNSPSKNAPVFASAGVMTTPSYNSPPKNTPAFASAGVSTPHSSKRQAASGKRQAASGKRQAASGKRKHMDNMAGRPTFTSPAADANHHNPFLKYDDCEEGAMEDVVGISPDRTIPEAFRQRSDRRDCCWKATSLALLVKDSQAGLAMHQDLGVLPELEDLPQIAQSLNRLRMYGYVMKRVRKGGGYSLIHVVLKGSECSG
jgi:hypothetical protein